MRYYNKKMNQGSIVLDAKIFNIENYLATVYQPYHLTLNNVGMGRDFPFTVDVVFTNSDRDHSCNKKIDILQCKYS